MKKLLSLFLAAALCGNSALAGISGQWIGGKGSIHSIGSRIITFQSVSISVVSSSVQITATSSASLASGTWGFIYTTPNGSVMTWSVEVAGTSASQLINISEADLGLVATNTVYVQAYYNPYNAAGLNNITTRYLIGSPTQLTAT